MSGAESGRGGVATALALLAVTGAALAASATAGLPAPAAPDSTPEAAEVKARELTPLVAARVERIRNLSFERIPVPEVVSAEEFAQISARATPSGRGLERELGDGEAVARLLGLMGPSEQLDELATGASELAAAAYDTRSERLYVIHDSSGEDPALLEFLLAHELTHALEDQRFGLAEPRGATDDEALAGIALIEGSATAVMVEYASRHLDPLELSAAAAGIEGGTGGVAAFFVESLTWAYLGGAEFVAALLGGDARDWAPVDRALDGDPPASTEQVLHPAAFRAGEEPIEVQPAIGPLGADWRVVSRGVLGEYTTAQLVRLGAPGTVGTRAASGWGGDGYALASRDGGGVDCEAACRSERILVVAWAWDDASQERDFRAALPAYLVGGLDATPAGRGGWRLGEGGWAAAASGDGTVRLAFAPTRALAEAAAGG